MAIFISCFTLFMNNSHIFYKIFILFTLFFCSYSHADYWEIWGSVRGGDPLKLCKGNSNSDRWITPKVTPDTTYVDCMQGMNYVTRIFKIKDDKCHHADTPATVLFDGSVPIVGCEPVQGGYCKWVLQGNPDNPFIINLSGSDKQSVVHVSQGFVTTCRTENKGECNPKDPYGGCYTPPDDGCTRQKDGSIVCPPEKEPEIKQGCDNNATYCNQPKDGCGENYVSGNFNGKPVCVIKPNIKSDNTSNNPSDNSSSSSSSSNNGNSSSGSSSDNQSNNSNSSSSDNSSSSSGSSSDNQSDNSSPNSAPTTQGAEKGKDGCENLSNCDWVKGSDFKDFTDWFKDLFSDKMANDLEKELDKEKIGELNQDGRITSAQNGLTSSVNHLSNLLTFSNHSCINDMNINVLGYKLTIPISQYCDIMALIKIFLQLGVYLLCLRLIIMQVVKL